MTGVGNYRQGNRGFPESDETELGLRQRAAWVWAEEEFKEDSAILWNTIQQ